MLLIDFEMDFDIIFDVLDEILLNVDFVELIIKG